MASCACTTTWGPIAHRSILEPAPLASSRFGRLIRFGLYFAVASAITPPFRRPADRAAAAVSQAPGQEEVSHGTRQTRRHRARQAQKSVEGRQGLLRAAQEYHSHCKAGGREGKPIRLSRSQASQTHLPRALDPAAQRASAALRAPLQP